MAQALKQHLAFDLTLRSMIPKYVDIWEFSEDRHALILAEIRAGVRITWMGCPQPFRYALSALPVALTGLLLAAFTGFVLAGLVGFQWPTWQQLADPFALATAALLIASIAMIFWPLWLAFKAGRTIYAVTTQRAIIFDGGLLSTVVRSFEVQSLSNLRRRQYSDGVGDLLFDITKDRAMDRINTTGPVDSTAGFYAVKDVQVVENFVRRLTQPEPPKKMDVLKPSYYVEPHRKTSDHKK